MELVRRLQGGGRAAYSELLDRYERRVFNLALRMLDGNRSEAEDATQEIFIAVHRSIGRFRGHARLDTWMHRIAVNVCLQHRRRSRVTTVPLCDADLAPAPEGDPFDGAARSEMRAAIGRAVGRLPEGMRAVVLLHGMEGLSYAEVAQALGCPVGTVKSRLSSALRRLRESLAEYSPGGWTPGTHRQAAPLETGR
jgi:RNA polymerase sigma-70 factor (ECF subfamily)